MSDHDKKVPEEGGGDVAVIGEGTPNRMPVSIQVLQGIYHELTGKTEEVSKSYSAGFQITHDALEQLNHRVTQICEQYNVRASNCSIKVFYVNDTQETFSSFERFRAFNAGSSSTVESVLLAYNFMIVLPKAGHVQSYTLTVRADSKIAIEKKMREEMLIDLPKIFKVMGNRTAVVTVKYVDYAVARTLLNVVDEWLKTVPKAQVPRWWTYLRRRTSLLPMIARYFVVALVALVLFLELPRFVPPTASLLDLAVFWLWASVGLFAAYRLAHHLGSTAEDSIDRWSELSYIALTAGDKTEIQSATKRNSDSLIAGILKFAGALLVSLGAKVIIDFISK